MIISANPPLCRGEIWHLQFRKAHIELIWSHLAHQQVSNKGLVNAFFTYTCNFPLNFVPAYWTSLGPPGSWKVNSQRSAVGSVLPCRNQEQYELLQNPYIYFKKKSFIFHFYSTEEQREHPLLGGSAGEVRKLWGMCSPFWVVDSVCLLKSQLPKMNNTNWPNSMSFRMLC